MSAPHFPMTRSARGFSLPEMLVASAVFLFVMIAAYTAFQRSQESYRRGQNQAEMIQGARVAFEQMSNDVRLAGFEFDLDGERQSYPGQPDEPIEYMHRRAIVVRGNFDFYDKELKGREPGLEFQGQSAECCPIVTTSNEEIVGFALSKPSGTLPTGSIVFKADTSGTEDADDEDRRDAFVMSDGTIVNEETVTIANVELLNPNAVGYAPPYTLYRFHLDEDGTVVRQPFIDNVYQLEFTYFDDAGVEIIGPNVAGTQALWGDDNGMDKEAGRLARWGVRQVRMRVQTMTPESDLDLRRMASSTTVPNFQGRRLFTLEADILPPNLGRRGSRDRDINPPEPPRNVELCSGQCKMVRVSWDPGPPEDKVADHVVTLCTDGPCEEDSSNVMASFIVIASFDVSEMQEYAVFTYNDHIGITEGAELYARVIARNAASTESECYAVDCPECCVSQNSAVVGETVRPGPFRSAIGGGYDPASVAFPNALPNNDPAGMLITVNPVSPYFPPSLNSQVSLTTPRYALNKSGAAGAAPNDWTTMPLGGAVTTPIACHKEESTPQDGTTDYRSPFNAFSQNPLIGNTYVWRVSASEASSAWGGAPNARSFVPTADNLLDFRYLPLQGNNVVYSDVSNYTFASSVHGDRYVGVGTNYLKVGGSQPVQAVTPCEVYYYRFRAVSLCWEDKPTEISSEVYEPPDGLRDADTFPAWAHDGNVVGFRAASRSISPWYPPMLIQGHAAGQRDKADPSVHDSDAFGLASALDTYATPSYTLPQRVVDEVTGAITSWVRPEAPSEFYITRINDSGDNILSGHGDPALQDARLIFNAARRTAPDVGQGAAQSAAYRTYRLYRKAATSATPAAIEFDFDTAQPAEYATFDTIGPLDVRHYTMQGSTLVPDASTFTLLRDIASDWAGASPDITCSNDPDDRPPGTTCIPWIYWLKTTQCTKFDDGIDTQSVETSAPSRPFQFPCDLVFDVTNITVTPATANTPPAQVSWTPNIFLSSGASSCSRIKAARLLAYGLTSGEYIGSSDWMNYNGGDSGNCETAIFASDDVQQAVRGFVTPTRFVVEISSGNSDRNRGEHGIPVGCRLRSDFGPKDIAEVRGIPVACASARSCGTQLAPNIFGTVDESKVELTDGNTKMLVRVPILLGSDCPGLLLVDLRQIELKLEKSLASGSNDIPAFVSAQVLAGLQSPRVLPSLATGDACDLVPLSNDQDAGEDDAGEADLDGTDGTMVLRWRDSFCEKTPDPDDDVCACEWNYPVVLATAPELLIELTFAGPLCDVRVTEFNFRVPLEDLLDTDSDGVLYEELVCTQRPRRIADVSRTNEIDSAICPDPTPGTPPGGPAGADPDLPEGCTLEGEGRGPSLVEEVACAGCTEDCQPCQCPLNNTDGGIAQNLNPVITLETDPGHDFGFPDTILSLEYVQQTLLPCSSPDCDFTIAEIEIEIVCGADRDCTDFGWPLMKYGDFEGPEPGDLEATRLYHGSTGLTVDLPNPTTADQLDGSYRLYRWTGLSVPIEAGETFRLLVTFDDILWGTVISKAAIRFAQPFAAECNADGSVGAGFGPLCDAPNDHVIPMP